MCMYVCICEFMSVLPEGRGQPCWLVWLYGCNFCHPRRLGLTANSVPLVLRYCCAHGQRQRSSPSYGSDTDTFRVIGTGDRRHSR